MKVILADRKSAVLARSSLGCLSNVASINLSSGCAHECIYCYGRGYRTYPGQRVIRLYANTASKLATELARKRRLPQTVYFSPSSDLFQPISESLDLAWEVLSILLDKQIPVALLTKGVIPERHMRLLVKHAPLVRVQVGLITLDESTRRIFEPHAAPSHVRLAQARDLTAAGILTTGRLDPILPGLTDADDTLRDVCGGFQKAGVRSLAAGILFLRPAVTRSLRENLTREPMRERLLAVFDSAERLRIHAENSSITALPASARTAVFNRLKAVAKPLGIDVTPCACKNPDIAADCCQIAGRCSAPASAEGQLGLFDIA